MKAFRSLFPRNELAPRLWIAAWLLAAGALAAVNGMKLVELGELPRPPSSAALSAVRVRLYAYEEALAQRRADGGASWERPLMPVGLPPTTTPPRRTPAAPPVAAELRPDAAAALPRLSGIVLRQEGGSARPSAAILDGRAYAEREGIAGFTVEKITAEGVWLTTKRGRWFLPAPEVHFTVAAPP